MKAHKNITVNYSSNNNDNIFLKWLFTIYIDIYNNN